MGLYKRDDSPVWWASYSLAGKQYRVSTGTTNKAEANQFLAKQVSGQRIPDKSSVAKLLDDLVTNYKINKTSKKSLEWCQQTTDKHLRPFFGSKKAQNLSAAEVRTFMAKKLDDGLSNATVNRCLSLLKRSYSLADMPFPRVSRLQERNVRTGFLEESDFWQLYRHLPGHLRPLVLFLYETGCRKSEALGLRWNQLDQIMTKPGKFCTVVRLNWDQTKNRHGRIIPLTEMLSALLTELQGDSDSDYIFSYHGRQLRDFRTGWAAACKAANLKDLLVHDLRKSAIRNMVRAGTSQVVAMAISGHRTSSVFQRYDIRRAQR